jgi:UDP-N-acetylglucosamine 2-epimerase (non-hydrolysing)
MPEEINRLVTDAIADVLWTPSADADENLLNEGISEEKIDLIGNIMIDSFELLREKIESSNSREQLGLADGKYALVTLHRPSNVDSKQTLQKIVDELEHVSEQMRLAFVIHPRTRKNLEKFAIYSDLERNPGITLVEPLPYIDFMGLATQSACVITDSGGLQEETTYLGIPCLTLRENTERPVTITLGTNRLVEPDDLLSASADILNGNWPEGTCPPFWDGRAASRAVASLEKRLAVHG